MSTPTTTQTEQQRHRRRWVGAILALLALVVLVKAVLVGRHAYDLWRHGMRLKGLASNPTMVLSPEVPPQLAADLGGTARALRGLRCELGWMLRPIWLPWRAGRENLLAVDELLRVGAELAEAGQVASSGLQPMTEAMAGRQASAVQGKPMSVALFDSLVQAQPQLRRAADQVGQAADDVSAIPAQRLWSPLSWLVPKLAEYLQLGHAGLEAAVTTPSLLGEDKPAQYLLLAQNNDELRATGGFVTGIGVVTVDKGKPLDLTIRDSYDFDKFTVDHPYAPEPMQRYMGIILWVTRDGNWSPDYPTAAQAVEDLYHLENHTEIKGVVAFDMPALQALVRAVGPLYIEEYQDQIDAGNVLQKAREYWAPTVPEGKTLREWLDEQGWAQVEEDWWTHRKDFMGLLAGALMAKLQAGGQADQLTELLWTVKRAIDEKHIQLYFHEPAVQGLLAMAGMDGALQDVQSGDYLLALDTNMGYNKVNLNVEKRMTYEVTLGQGGSAQASLTITYENHSPPQPECVHRPRIAATYDGMAQDCYWNYLRVYVPLGSELLHAEGVTQTETLSEAGKTLFTTFLVVPAAQSHTVRFTYRLPAMDPAAYHLLVQKQAGTDAVPLAVRLVLPADVGVLSAEPAPKSHDGQVLSFDVSLRQDRRVAVKLR
jgi:hypothetical protein